MSSTSSVQRRSSVRRLVLVAALAAVLLVPAGAVRGSGPDGILEGYVTSSSNGAAIAGALVQVAATDLPWSFETTTDARGFYSISLPNHDYSVDVSSGVYDENSTSAGVGSGLTTWFNVTLDPASARSAQVQGFVKDSGSAAAVTSGRVVLATPSWWYNPPYTNGSALNATGYYSIAVVPGDYVLTTDGVQGYVPYSYSYLYPSTGQVLWYNFTMSPLNLVAWLNGTVEDSGNYTPIAGASVTAAVGGDVFATTTSNATGAYSIHAPTGTIVLAADAPGYAPGSTNAYVYWPGSTTVNLYVASLSTGVTGKVLNGLTGTGIPNVLVVVGPFWGTGYYDQARSSASGSYAVSLPPGTYYVSASAPGFTPDQQYVSLSAGQVTPTNLTLWPIVATVRGYVIDGGTGLPLPAVNVYAWDARTGFGASAATDASGLYSLLLPPSPAIGLRIYGAAPYAGAVVYLTSVAFATTWANITLPRLDAVVAANVTDATTGLPISGAVVALYWTVGSNYGYTDATGQASVGVPSGMALTAYAWATGHLSWSASLPAAPLPASVSVRLYPVLTANVTVEGYVRDAVTNASLTFASVQASGYGPYVASGYTDSTGFYSISTVPAPQTVRAQASGYAVVGAPVNPAGGSTIWVNFSLPRDAAAPRILNFTANPAANVGPGNPSLLYGQVNESDLFLTQISILLQTSAAGGVGTYVDLGALPSWRVGVASLGGNLSAVSSSFDTRMGIARLSDGISSTWWPATPYGPFQLAVYGYWTNATHTTATAAAAIFDGRSGTLLYVNTAYGLYGPQDQPASTFMPYASGIKVNLTTSAIGASLLVTGPAFQVGTLTGVVSSLLPGGSYGALLDAYDYSYNHAAAVALFQAVGDTTPPVANAGPDQTVNQGTAVTFDGTRSTDDVGITGYRWSFTDGGAKVLTGATPTYRFLNAGTFLVTLTVTDVGGNTASDTMLVTVRDTTAPTVALSAPADGAVVNGSVTVTATASDNVGVVRVEFRVDGALVGNVTTSPYTIRLDTRVLANGNHTITAAAFDAAGNSAESVRHVTVLNASSGSPILFGLDLFTIGLLGLVVAVALVVAVVLLRRRRPRAPMPLAGAGPTAQQAPPPPPGSGPPSSP